MKKMKKTIAFLVIATVVMSVAAVGVVMAKKDGCTTIQDGTLVDTKGNPITMGYDQWGYNYQAHMFNGWYHNSPRPVPPYTKDTIDQAPSKTRLVMWWSDEWLSNKDCNGDGKLDRGYSCNPEDPVSSACDSAWLTNHQWGSYEDEETGETCNWNYFVKMVYVNPDNAYKATDPEDGILYWYTSDGEKIGSVIWGAYARIQQVYNDPCAGDHGIEYLSPTSPGFGYYN